MQEEMEMMGCLDQKERQEKLEREVHWVQLVNKEYMEYLA